MGHTKNIKLEAKNTQYARYDRFVMEQSALQKSLYVSISLSLDFPRSQEVVLQRFNVTVYRTRHNTTNHTMYVA